MLSGNGRHRRPRQAPALLVAAGVAGSAIAIPLLGATGASAASGTTWDAVADCESGGSWSADSGNGSYGGLQMTQEMWEGYGGLDYASSADQASRSQQIAVAEKVLADQGIEPWGACGLVAGLSQHSESADVDTGLAQDSASPSPDSGSTTGDSSTSTTNGDNDTKSGESDESVKSDSSVYADDTTDDSGDDTDADADADSQSSASPSTGDVVSPDSTDSTGTTKSDESDNSAQNGDASTGADTDVDADDVTDSGSGRHRGGSAAEDATGSRTDDSAGRHASRGDSAPRDATDGSYTVRAGDSLSGIVDSLGLEGGWRELYAANKGIVGTDPDLILPGQSLELGNGQVAANQ
ncbi:transglycosylase family protein [Streptomyces sp. 2A115]|uniref:transglycosylase family protein n=1 Tax=Streptomyces sp. 2A115 TaxID=3457439 RepID=UPI003FCEFFBA